MHRNNQSTRFLHTKTLADTVVQKVSFQDDDIQIERVNKNLDFNSKLLTLLSSFGITDISKMTPRQQKLINQGIILLKFAMHNFTPAQNVLRNNDCDIDRLGKNKVGLVKAMKEAEFLYVHEDVQVFLGAEGITIDKIATTAPEDLSDIQLPENVENYMEKVRQLALQNTKELYRPVWKKILETKIGAAWLNKYQDNAKLIREINSMIVKTSKDAEAKRERLSLQMKLVRVTADKMFYQRLLSIKIHQLKHLIQLALRNGAMADLQKILLTMAPELTVAERNISEANANIITVLKYLENSPYVPVDKVA
jgi:hypothetical protein